MTFFQENEVYLARNNMIFATKCAKIDHSWVEEDPGFCSKGIKIHFIHEQHNTTGFLTKYHGIISDKTTLTDDCEKKTSFSLPHSTMQLVRSKNHVYKKNYEGPSVPLLLDTQGINILKNYRKIFSNDYVFFVRDLLTFLSILLIFVSYFDKKKIMVFVNYFLAKFIRKIEKNLDEESVCTEYATIAALEEGLAKSKNYTDIRAFEIKELISQNNRLNRSANYVNQSPVKFNGKSLDDYKYQDIQKILKTKEINARGTLIQLRERLSQAIIEESRN